MWLCGASRQRALKALWAAEKLYPPQKGDPQGLKPVLILASYAALKRRSSTALPEFITFFRSC
jgi:hypothetical protein